MIVPNGKPIALFMNYQRFNEHFHFFFLRLPHAVFLWLLNTKWSIVQHFFFSLEKFHWIFSLFIFHVCIHAHHTRRKVRDRRKYWNWNNNYGNYINWPCFKRSGYKNGSNLKVALETSFETITIQYSVFFTNKWKHE